MLPSENTSNPLNNYKISNVRSNEQNLRSKNQSPKNNNKDSIKNKEATSDSFEYASNVIKGGLMDEDQNQVNLQINGSRAPISAFSS